MHRASVVGAGLVVEFPIGERKPSTTGELNPIFKDSIPVITLTHICQTTFSDMQMIPSQVSNATSLITLFILMADI